MSSPAVTPNIPTKAVPPQVRCGDAYTWWVKTEIPVVSLFLVLTGTINGVPTRYFLGTPTSPISVDATGTAQIAVTGTASAAWLPGRYQWILFGIDGSGNRDELAQGYVRVEPDPAGATPVDTRSYNEKLCHAIRCLLQGKANDDVVMYKIGSRELTKMSIDDLERWYARVESRVRRERIRRGEYVPTKTVGITFGGRGPRA